MVSFNYNEFQPFFNKILEDKIIYDLLNEIDYAKKLNKWIGEI
jgi:hypothetical protein